MSSRGERPGRVRRAHSKDSNGCLTCKERRIKCDTTKPTCNRCKASNRTCGGYSLVFKNVGASQVSKKGVPVRAEIFRKSGETSSFAGTFNVLDFTAISGDACVPLRFFLDHCVPELFTQNQAALWSKSFASRCAAGSPVFHAALAVGYAHEEFLSTKNSYGKSAIALEHYHLALTRTNAIISNSTRRTQIMREEVALLAILFVCFELLVGHDEKALYHLEGGLKIVNEFEPSSTSDPAYVAVSKTFMDLDLQALAMLGWRRPALVDAPGVPLLGPQNPRPTMTREELNDFLMTGHKQIQRSCYFMRIEAQEHKYDERPPAEIEKTRVEYLDCMQSWAACTASVIQGTHLGERHITKSPPGPAQKLLLTILVTLIKLSCCLSPFERSYDAFEDQFREIIALAEAILSVHNSRPLRKRFTLHCAVVEPLYFTACKCRHPIIRRQAIEQLTRAGQQGGWNGSTMANVARGIMDIEESARYNVSADSNDSYGIPESCRIHGAMLTFAKPAGVVRANCFMRSRGGNEWQSESFEMPL